MFTADSKVRKQIKELQDAGYGNYPVCVAKTQYSFSTDPKLLGALSRTGVNGITLGLVGRNLFTWTSYKGYDPEVSDSDFPSTIKLDSFGYPRYRTITGTVQIEF